MFGQAKFDNMPRVRNYEEALYTYNNIKPWRGTGDGDNVERPINKRSEKHKTVRKLSDGSIAFRLYRTDCVTYHPDNTVTVCTYHSQSTAAFMDWVMPVNTHVTMHQGRMYVGVREGDGGDRQFSHYREGKEPIRLRKLTLDEKPRWANQYTIVNKDTLVRDYVKRVNRANAKAVREQLLPLINWIRAVAALGNGDVTELVRNRHYENLPNLLPVFASGEMEEGDYPLFLVSLSKNVWHGPSANTRRLNDSWERALIDAAYKHSDALEKVEVPLGELPPRSKW